MIEVASYNSAEVAHHTPGRLRLRVIRGIDNPAILEKIKTAFGHVTGVETVETRAASGSVVVLYDPDNYADMSTLVRGLARQAAPAAAARTAPVNGTKRPATKAAARANGKARPATSGPEPGVIYPEGHPHHRPPKTHLGEVTEQIEEEAEFLAEHSHTARVVVDWAKDLDRGIKRATNNNLDLKIMVPLGLAAVTFLEIGAAAATPMWVTLAIFSLNHFVELHAHDADDEEDDEGDAPGEAQPA
jgi:hypothetical protein